jgi:peptide/nickel transport system ATP-binding protein
MSIAGCSVICTEPKRRLVSSSTTLPTTESTSGSAPLLEVRGLSNEYGIGRVGRHEVVAALTDVDLTIASGEVLGLVGESGSGKTTFARTLVYLERATAGTISVDGEVMPKHPSPGRLREHRRKVQMIFQDPYSSLDPLHTVASAVTQPLRAFNIVPRRQERAEVEELLHQVGLTPVKDFLSRYPHELSGGQRQRVGVARALAARPKLLIADEPTSMLDVSIRLTIMNLLLDLQQSHQLSLIFITHDLAAARYVSDRIAIMYAGRLVELGSAGDVLGEPRHPYTMLLRDAAPDPAQQGLVRIRSEERGEPPDLTALPVGCAFAPRCNFARDECLVEFPAWRRAGEGHEVRCVLVDEEAP